MLAVVIYLETLLTITEATIAVHFSAFTLRHYILLSVTLSDIKWSLSVSTTPCHTPFVYSMAFVFNLGTMCQSRHSKPINFSSVDQFCFTLTAVGRPFQYVEDVDQHLCPPLANGTSQAVSLRLWYIVRLHFKFFAFSSPCLTFSTIDIGSCHFTCLSISTVL